MGIFKYRLSFENQNLKHNGDTKKKKMVISNFIIACFLNCYKKKFVKVSMFRNNECLTAS